MKILSFDVESNGLQGTAFAVGAVVLDTETCVQLTRFTGRVDIHLMETIDVWVEANVLPHIGDLDYYGLGGHSRLVDMRDAFWAWLQEWKEGALVIADFGWPVEARFLAACIDDRPADRTWNGPYPMHELGTLLLAVGADPDSTNRREWYKDMPEFGGEGAILKQHNPLDDALAAGWCAIKALRLLRVVTPNVT
jgi:hypothetical protein